MKQIALFFFAMTFATLTSFSFSFEPDLSSSCDTNLNGYLKKPENRTKATDYYQISKEQLWTNFWTKFKNAVNKKNKKELQKLSDPDDSNFNEEIGASGKEFSQRETIESSSWRLMRTAIATGVKSINANKKSTKDDVLVFVFRNNNWYWYGIIAD